MANITVTLTDTQIKSLEYSAYSVQDWANNALQERARIAQEEIISKLVAHCNANDVAIAGSITGLATDGLANVTGLGTAHIIKTNAQTISENITIPSDTNGMSAGTITIADGYTVTVNGNWSVV